MPVPASAPQFPKARESLTVRWVLAHLIEETARHAGHADIVRESIDGAIGNGQADQNIPQRSAAEWEAYRSRLEEVARAAAAAAGEN